MKTGWPSTGRIRLPGLILAAWSVGVVLVAADEPQAVTVFRESIAGIFEQRCLRCHNSVDRKGSFALQRRDELFDSGYVAPRDPDGSELLGVLRARGGGQPVMPKDGPPLSDGEVDAIRRWIAAGAPWPEGAVLREPAVLDADWWSLRPIARPAVPATGGSGGGAGWMRTPIDAFILDALRAQGLAPSREADRPTLIRRLYFDLIGLPPTPGEIDDFVRDDQPLAYERLVDWLLGSQHYGERWAPHWLDVVKYADTCGYDKDKLRPNAWPYRDYVIRSLNADKPYGRFIEEQIAGDVLHPETPDGILGLGFLAAGPWDFIGHVEVPESKIDGKIARHHDRDEMVSNTLNTFCSTTIQCCQCHNHKFDPFTQEHYYDLQSVFAAVDRAERPYELDPAVEQQRQDLRSQLGGAESQRKALKDAAGADGSGELAALERRIADLKRELSGLPPRRVVYAAATEFAKQGSFEPTRGKPRIIRVLHRGNVQQPREPAVPGTIPVIPGVETRFDLPDPHGEGDRRAALARWLSRPDNPLTWRSIVNRIWQNHFGRGLVDSPNDFGRMGKLPTHPELLDWLAAEFRDGGGSFKWLHRLIVTSAVYRQSSAHDERAARVDGENQFLWRMHRRRLDAEEIRDAMLAVSGKLDRAMGGPGYYLFVLERPEHSPHYEYHKFDPEDPGSHRRSVYRFIVRSQPDPFMTTLDCADSSQSTPRRHETLTAPQALSLLNNRFCLSMSRHFARRLIEEQTSGVDPVELAMMLIAGRLPTDREQCEFADYARRHGLENLCRVLFNLSEFVYVD
jgi:hypothetical protein